MQPPEQQNGFDPMSFDEAEQLLLTADIEEVQTLWSSSNYVFAARLCVDGRRFGAIYKPLKGETPLWDFPPGLYRREVAAYRFARLVGWPLIPPTIVRDGPHGIGSLQLLVAHDRQSHFFNQRETAELVPQLQQMAVFDFVANNADRKGGHCLLDSERRIWAIDHGLCFHETYKLRTVIWDWADEAISEVWLARLEEVGLLVAAQASEAAPVLELLSAAESDAVLARTESLLERRKFPTPGPHRHYPWPLV